MMYVPTRVCTEVNGRKGYIALLSILIVAAIAASTVLTLFITSLTTTLNSGDTATGRVAKAAAEACGELALQRLSGGLTNPCNNCLATYPITSSPLLQCSIVYFSGMDGALPNVWTIRTQASDPKNTITKYLEIRATRASPAAGAVLRSWRECLNFSTTPPTPCPMP